MPIDHTELRRLHEAATPGPWFGQYEYDGGRTVCQMRSTSETFCVNKSADVEAENPCRKTKENAELIAYLRNHVPDILAALEDRERLEWLETSGMTQLTLGWESFEAAREDRKPVWIVGKTGDDEPFKGHAPTIRAAIDAARRGGQE